ncbi:MAG: PD-(D/E)XK nuclease family protein [Sphingomonas sp.]|nr:PD-(D/E)XK nuclease family protein [Sphingomonas sp.]
MMTSQSDFGSYLAVVYERDIDLLLMEEFHASEGFVAWFAGRLGIEDAKFDGAWHSVTDADGETDLLLRVKTREQRIGILIENKVSAPEQDRQSERYHLRATRAQEEKKFDAFVTSICAPEVYLNGLAEDRLYQGHISYESIADWFASRDGPRNEWRHRIMREAINQGRRGYTMIVNPAVTGFHQAFWEHVQRHYPAIAMRRPTSKGNKSNWILMKGRDFPSYAQLHFKMDQCVVELGFLNRQVSEILARKDDWPGDVIPVQKGKTAALAIRIPPVDRMASFASQAESIGEVFKALLKLLPHGRLLETPDLEQASAMSSFTRAYLNGEPVLAVSPNGGTRLVMAFIAFNDGVSYADDGAVDPYMAGQPIHHLTGKLTSDKTSLFCADHVFRPIEHGEREAGAWYEVLRSIAPKPIEAVHDELEYLLKKDRGGFASLP